MHASVHTEIFPHKVEVKILSFTAPDGCLNHEIELFLRSQTTLCVMYMFHSIDSYHMMASFYIRANFHDLSITDLLSL